MLYRIYFGFMDCFASAVFWWQLLQTDSPTELSQTMGIPIVNLAEWRDEVFKSKMETW